MTDFLRPSLPSPLGELPSRVGIPGRFDDRRLSSPVLGIITAGQLRSLDDTSGVNLGAMGGIPTTWTAGINFENTSLGSMTEYLNFNSSAGISFLKHPKFDLRHNGDAFFNGQLDITESAAAGSLWDAAIVLRDPLLAHGITTITPTNVYALFTDVTPSLGGLRIETFNNTAFPNTPTMIISVTMSPITTSPGLSIESWVVVGATRSNAVPAGIKIFTVYKGQTGAGGTLLFSVESSGIVSTPQSVLVTKASDVTIAGLNLPHGIAPAAPTNGDVWTTAAGLFAYISGATVGPFGAGGAASDPQYAPGTFSLATGKFRVQVRRLILTGAQRATLQGTACLKIIGN